MALSFPRLTQFVLTWTLTDTQGNPINNATVSATLYANRSLQQPDSTPGTAVPPIDDTALTYVAASNGMYSATIPATLDPTDEQTQYVLVVDGSISGTPVYHTEQIVAIQGASNNVDLTTLDQVKAWIPGLTPGTPSADDALLQFLITSWSQDFLIRTGLGDQVGDYDQSPFVQVCSFNETYDGKGGIRLFLKNRPIIGVSVLYINGIPIVQSTGPLAQGWVVDGTGKSISLRGSGNMNWSNEYGQSWQAGPYYALNAGLRFFKGVQNVNVQYTAGYASTPFDVVECANKVVAQNYRRRSWIDEASRSIAGGGGTTRFRDWAIPPECASVIERYTRWV